MTEYKDVKSMTDIEIIDELNRFGPVIPWGEPKWLTDKDKRHLELFIELTDRTFRNAEKKES